MSLIKSESELIFKLHKIASSSFCSGDFLIRITSIPKGERITPDLDLVCIQRYKQNSPIIAWEVKLVRKEDPFKYFYQGLGQALCYFQHGINKVYLLVGCFKGFDKSTTNKIQNEIGKLCNFLKTYHLIPPYFGVQIISNSYKYLQTILEAEIEFSLTNENCKHKRECLLRGEYEYAKKWYKKKEEKYKDWLSKERLILNDL